mmetsp:Transcript_15889/g.43965  ORF Transcript_15889/g.43965 Transcript_15889/m.43965 type:complete len:95 (+) Transcript_15889:163-447(+)
MPSSQGKTVCFITAFNISCCSPRNSLRFGVAYPGSSDQSDHECLQQDDTELDELDFWIDPDIRLFLEIGSLGCGVPADASADSSSSSPFHFFSS